MTGGLERALYRVARKHAGQQRGGWTCRVELLREKTGSDSTVGEFNRMLRKLIEADQLPEYTLSMTKTGEGAAAVLFELRGAAEAAELHAKLDADRERRERADAERRRTQEVDALMDRLARGQRA